MNPEQSTRLCDIKYKIVFLGEMYTGKSSIIQRFVKNRFDQKNNQTIGVDLINKNVCFDSNTYKLQLWDTAGQEKYRSLVPAYIRDTHCAVFVYDITNQSTLNNLNEWLEMFRNYQPADAVAILIGNKNDRKDERKVMRQNGQQWAKKYNMAFAQVSAKTGQGIQDVFHCIVQNINTNKQQNIQLVRSINMGTTKNQQNNYQKQGKSSSLQSSNRIHKKTSIKVNQPKKKEFACCYI